MPEVCYFPIGFGNQTEKKKPRLEFPLNLAVSEMEETEQGSK